MSGEGALLAGQVALVTGAARGIGRAIARRLGGAGAALALLDVDAEGLDRTCRRLAEEGLRAHPLVCDVRDAAALREAVAAARGALGRLDVLVNNAGGSFDAPFLQVSDRGYRTLLDLNLTSVWVATQAAAAHWTRAGVAGRVVNVTSTEGQKACPGHAAYAAAKAGVISLTMTLAAELGPYGIRVNALAPDYTRLEVPVAGLAAEAPDEEAIAAHIPLRRYGAPDDMAGPALFLATDLSGWITGQTLVVDGGAGVAARVEGALPVRPQDRPTRRRPAAGDATGGDAT